MYTLANEMLESTNVYSKPVSALEYGSEDNPYKLLDMVNDELRRVQRRGRILECEKKQKCFKAIGSAMVEYWEHYPASFVYKQRMGAKLYRWLTKIRKMYDLQDQPLPDELRENVNGLDHGIELVKALHSRDGVLKED